MKLSISSWAIRHPVPVAVLFIALLIAGSIGYTSLPVKLYPDVSFPLVKINISVPGAAASEVEKQITDEVETAVSNLANVDHVQSTVTQGLSRTTVEFEIGEDPQKATDEVRAAIDRIRSSLPKGIEEPIIERFEIDSEPVVTYAVSGTDHSDLELSWLVDDVIARRLVTAPGVAQVQRVGGVDREINVTLNPERLEALGLTAPQINNALRSASIDVPGGRAEVGGREQTVRVLGAADTVEALGNMVLSTSAGRDIRLADVATVASGAAERRGFADLNGQSVVGFQVMKTPKASDVAVAREIERATAQLALEFPDLHFLRVYSIASGTQDSFTATLHSLIEGMLLAALVVFLFLRSWRATIITALAMPVSLIPAFAAMHYMDFSLNMITLLALTLVIGILVDDAIVEIENIQKRVEAGQNPYIAAMEGADQIGLAVLATTLTIVVVFLPVAFMGGFAGQFFKEFGFTVAIAVLFSLLVARMLTPLLAAYFIKPAKHPQPPPPFEGVYRRLLDLALSHRWLSLALGAGLTFGSLFLAATFPIGVIPPDDNGILHMTLEGAPGATLDDMRGSSDLLTQKLLALPDVDAVFTLVGSGSLDGDIRSGSVTLLLSPERKRTTQQVEAQLQPLLMSIPDLRIGFALTGPSGSQTIQIVLTGDDSELLEATALTLERQMRDAPGLSNVHQRTPRPGAELVITPKPDEAARLGVSAETLGAIARVATLGDVDANTAKFNTGEQRVFIRVRLPDEARADLSTLRNLRVPTASGKLVPLSAVATLSFQAGVARIERYDQRRRAIVEAQFNGISLGDANKAIYALPIMQALPEGIAQTPFGDSERMNELFAGFSGAMVAGVGLIFAVLVLLFHSFFKPITILTALPLSLSGAFVGLLISGYELGLSVLIGLLMLMGLAAKNSILLVEFAIEAEREGASQREAVLRACRERARPIIMTTVAMAAGMVPTALAIGAGGGFRAPMAIAVIGGLISSTLLSLVLVPVVYELIDDFEIWVKPKLARLVGTHEPPQTAATGSATPDAEELTPTPRGQPGRLRQRDAAR
jgi:HAE1 family hydrophobic/amphiphilic exporter-1